MESAVPPQQPAWRVGKRAGEGEACAPRRPQGKCETAGARPSHRARARCPPEPACRGGGVAAGRHMKAPRDAGRCPFSAPRLLGVCGVGGDEAEDGEHLRTRHHRGASDAKLALSLSLSVSLSLSLARSLARSLSLSLSLLSLSLAREPRPGAPIRRSKPSSPSLGCPSRGRDQSATHIPTGRSARERAEW